MTWPHVANLSLISCKILHNQNRFASAPLSKIELTCVSGGGGGGGGEVPSPGSRVQQPSAGQSSSQQTISNVGYEEHIAASRGLATDAPAEHTQTNVLYYIIVTKCLLFINNKNSAPIHCQ